MDNLYLLFNSADFYFLAPLSWVKSIEAGSNEAGELPALVYARDKNSGGHTTSRYRIVMENKGRCFVLEADSVAGIEELEGERLKELSEPVINKRNKCLKAAVFMDTVEEKEILAFVLDMEYIAEEEEQWSI